MLTQFLAGVLFAWVLSYIGIGLSFCITYLVHRREPEHLVFGLSSLAMAIHAVGLMLAYAHAGEDDTRLAVRMTMFGTLLGSALVVHFALLFAKINAPMRWMRFVYLAAAAFAVANASDLLTALKSADPVPMRVGSIMVEHLQVVTTPLGGVAIAAVAFACTASLGVILQATLGGRRDHSFARRGLHERHDHSRCTPGNRNRWRNMAQPFRQRCVCLRRRGRLPRAIVGAQQRAHRSVTRAQATLGRAAPIVRRAA